MSLRAIVPTLLLAATATAYADRAITVDVDARNMARRLVSAHLVIPAQPGKVVLRYAKWMPGEHGPTGPIAAISKLVLTAAGKPLAWTRDPIDLYTFNVDVPKGATEIAADVELVLPESGEFSSGATATENLAVVSWNHVLLFPDGKSSDDVRCKASVRLPKDWKSATALPIARQNGDRLDLSEVSLTTLVDSPVLAGKYFREIVLADAPRARLVIVSDSQEALAVPDEVIAGYKRLVAEAGALFGARHYKSYTFLLTLSDRVAHFGLEHHESSDDRLPERVFLDDDDTMRHRPGQLLSHEYVHSWNGKYRRPAGLAPGRFDVPMQGDLLWVYEGLTEYLGMILSARAGLDSAENQRARFAVDAGQLEVGAGRAWRPLADTAVAAQQLYGPGAGWLSRARSVDYYPEGALLWLEIDAIIRAKTKGAKSLDDFCKAFYGTNDGMVGVVPYKLDDVIETLNSVTPYDWRGFLDKRVFGLRPKAPVEGLEAAGWKLVYQPKLPATLKASEAMWKYLEETWTAGLVLDEHQVVADVVPGSPADRAGIAPAMKIVAVDGRSFSPERFREAIARTKDHPGMDLLVQHGDTFFTAKLDLRGGPRYPGLERVGGSEDLLGAIFTAKTH
jgi:predicted metalloprotease with PDZ domain